MTKHSLSGKTAVVTGATSGIGAVVAHSLAAMGSRVIIVARNPDLATVRIATLPEVDTGPHQLVLADLSTVDGAKRAASEVAQFASVLDILVNNAGALFPQRGLTTDGMERTFALNHISYFVMTLGLLDQLMASPQGRVVVTSSRLHSSFALDFSDLQNEKKYTPYKAYGRSKLCNILFTRALARRLDDSRITVNALHPGYVATHIGEDDKSLVGRLDRLMKVWALSPEAGARTTLHVATSQEAGQVSGAYFVKCKQAKPSPRSDDLEAAERLWSESLRLAGVNWPE